MSPNFPRIVFGKWLLEICLEHFRRIFSVLLCRTKANPSLSKLIFPPPPPAVETESSSDCTQNTSQTTGAYCNFTNFRCSFIIVQYFGWSMVLPKFKRHLNEKNALRDNDSIHGHRNLNDTEHSVIAHHRNFNVPKICKFTVLLPWPKKKNHPRDSRREERCSTCDIMLDQARSAQGKSRGQSRIGLALR